MPLCKLRWLGCLVRTCRAAGSSAEVRAARLSACLVTENTTLSVVTHNINLFNSYQQF